jgi:hypothetical protein
MALSLMRPNAALLPRVNLRCEATERLPSAQRHKGMRTLDVIDAELRLLVVIHTGHLDPAGLWTKENPWTLDFMSGPPDQLPGLLFDDPDAGGVRAMFPIRPAPRKR